MSSLSRPESGAEGWPSRRCFRSSGPPLSRQWTHSPFTECLLTTHNCRSWINEWPVLRDIDHLNGDLPGVSKLTNRKKHICKQRMVYGLTAPNTCKAQQKEHRQVSELENWRATHEFQGKGAWPNRCTQLNIKLASTVSTQLKSFIALYQAKYFIIWLVVE